MMGRWDTSLLMVAVLRSFAALAPLPPLLLPLLLFSCGRAGGWAPPPRVGTPGVPKVCSTDGSSSCRESDAHCHTKSPGAQRRSRLRST